jgi:integrase
VRRKKFQVLTVKEIERLTLPGYYHDGQGLYLQVSSSGTKSWVLRYTLAGRTREMGLGPLRTLGLADARKRAAEQRLLVADMIDPIEHRRARKSQLIATRAAAVTFKDAADAYIAKHEPSWRNPKHAQQWRNTLESYAYPVLGAMLVSDIRTEHIERVLEPIWHTKTETAKRLRGRIAAVIEAADKKAERNRLNPARWDGHLSASLPEPSKVAPREHFPALPIGEVPAFMAALRMQHGTGARALEFAILCAARSGEVRGAKWSEIDLAAALWVVPASRMKAAKEHRVPLSAAAVDLLRALPPGKPGDYVFPSTRGGSLSDMTLAAVIKRMNGLTDVPRWIDPRVQRPVVPHGFRSTFRDWAAERTAFPAEMVEMALAHTIASKVEAAYRRGDLFEKRRKLMEAWAAYCFSRPMQKGDVIPIRARVAR